ncbi:MAG: hypothetical protein KDM81_14375, partial [Verrucomicrobiae bacterium]|nr:hypothetical protein [Verrucomicrobiae bacterium]
AGLAVALHWPNPLAWLAAGRLRIEQERACDDLVLTSGGRASDYAEELLQMATTRRATTWAPAIAMARRSTVERRLLAVLDGARSRCAARRRWWLWGGAIIAGVAAPLAAVTLTEQPEEPPAAYEEAKVADPSQSVEPNTSGSALSWGPIEERVMSFDLSGRTARLDLDTGEFVDVAGAETTDASATAGLFDTGKVTDLAISPVESDSRARMGVNLAVVPADADAWSASPEEALHTLLGQVSHAQVRLAPGDTTRTWFIRTDEGNVGVVDLTPNAQAFGEVHVRWRLVQGPKPSPEAKLQFRVVSNDPTQPAETLLDHNGRPLRVLKQVLLDDSAVAHARIENDPLDGHLLIGATLTPWGAAQFAGITGRHLDGQLAMVFEGKLLIAPIIRDRIVGGKLQISGNLTEDEAQKIVDALNLGKPPIGDEAGAPGHVVLVVSQNGTGDYRTIQAAINAVPTEGGAIHIQAGDYAENLEITKSVDLIGEDWTKVTIRPANTSTLTPEELEKQVAAQLRLATSEAERREIQARFKDELGRPVLTIRDCGRVRVRGLKFTALSENGRSLAPEIVGIRRADVWMRECGVVGGPRDGIRVADAARLDLSFT